MWNYYSYPKWTYSVPFVSFWPIFEMPLLGYGGYIGFSFELYALYHLLKGTLVGREPKFVQLVDQSWTRE
jgi:hypothetical protein